MPTPTAWGLAAAQLARAAGAEVFATADSPQGRDVLESLGFDATGGAGVRCRSLALDVSLEADPARLRAVLGDVIGRIASGALKPLPASRWPLAEARQAMEYVRSDRHAGKAVLVPSPLARRQPAGTTGPT